LARVLVELDSELSRSARQLNRDIVGPVISGVHDIESFDRYFRIEASISKVIVVAVLE
jgi:hypothetical protein